MPLPAKVISTLSQRSFYHLRMAMHVAPAARLGPVLVLVLLTTGVAQTTLSGSTPVVSLPREAVSRIPSPNKKWTLIFKAPDMDDEGRLWIQRNGRTERTLVRDFGRSLDISWSPDGRHFFVNDASGSTETLC